MDIVKSNTVNNVTPAIAPTDASAITVVETISLTAGQVVNGNVIELAVLPAGAVPISYVLALDDLDSNGTPTITTDFGIINSGETAVSTATADGGGKWLTASTLSQAGGIALSTASKTTYDVVKSVTPTDTNRIVGIVIVSAVATAQAGKARLELTYASSR